MGEAAIPATSFLEVLGALTRIRAAVFCSFDQARDLQRVESVTIRHYSSFCYQLFKHRRKGVMVRRSVR
ncbi:hypothetical protein E2C01_023316 [Portunus trituberculatus]|uniref:Uncharacterized protein n=1 Tax=Portunus trituberculatus TaxID=210409 RepID=A0A5B7EAU1_PORTR|nr:hypothetical protein [Portunus trituberculatus]